MSGVHPAHSTSYWHSPSLLPTLSYFSFSLSKCLRFLRLYFLTKSRMPQGWLFEWLFIAFKGASGTPVDLCYFLGIEERIDKILWMISFLRYQISCFKPMVSPFQMKMSHRPFHNHITKMSRGYWSNYSEVSKFTFYLCTTNSINKQTKTRCIFPYKSLGFFFSRVFTA